MCVSNGYIGWKGLFYVLFWIYLVAGNTQNDADAHCKKNKRIYLDRNIKGMNIVHIIILNEILNSIKRMLLRQRTCTHHPNNVFATLWQFINNNFIVYIKVEYLIICDEIKKN